MVVDEVRISKEANPYYAWSLKGKTPIKTKKLELHKSKNIFGALSMKKGNIIQYHCTKKKGQFTKLLDKIKEFKQENYPDTKKKILVLLDNVSYHKGKDVKQWLTDNPGVLELDNFPPYSPEMNPIEHCWKDMKKHINHLRGEASLTEIMKQARQFLNKKTFNYKLFGHKFF